MFEIFLNEKYIDQNKNVNERNARWYDRDLTRV